MTISVAGWSSLVARWAHNPKVEGSNPSPATNIWGFTVPTVNPLFVIRRGFFSRRRANSHGNSAKYAQFWCG